VIVVLLVAAGGGWESAAMNALDRPGDIVVFKRCVDIDDLLATATSGQAEVAVVALDAPGLDARAVDHLRHHGVRTVGVGPATASGQRESADERARVIGLSALVADDDPEALVAAVRSDDGAPLVASPGVTRPDARAADPSEPAGVDGTHPGRVITVWGPAGSPGRTTVAAGLAAVLASHGPSTLVDADPYGGAVAQVLGILDEVSGLLTAVRRSRSPGSAGPDDGEDIVRRRLDRHLGVVTGLPRSDRWSEVRPGALEDLLAQARAWGHVVVDTGFSVEPDLFDRGAHPARNQLTFEALSAADEIVVVATPDPVGLARLSRGLDDLDEVVGHRGFRVVVNRMRSSLSWSEREVARLVEGFGESIEVRFLPEDREAVDRALVTGRTLTESAPASPLVRALSALASDLVGDPHLDRALPRRRIRTRRAAATHPR
jgi:MinD-like ATPase involved in chromosome partitioning or flagellar assembly